VAVDVVVAVAVAVAVDVWQGGSCVAGWQWQWQRQCGRVVVWQCGSGSRRVAMGGSGSDSGLKCGSEWQ
jgi:hypothetical protein